MARKLRLTVLLLTACDGSIWSPAGTGPMGQPGPTIPQDPMPGGIPGGTAPTGACTDVLAPRRVWTLSRMEFDNSVNAVLGNASNQAQNSFPGENRANGFASNPQAEVVDSTLINLLMTAAETIAAQSVNNELTYITGTLACTLAASPTMASPDPCATKYITQRGQAFFRRPPTPDEVTDLYATYLVGVANPYANTAATASGVEIVLATLLQLPQFYYRTELGSPDDTSSPVQLTQYEIASAIAFMASGAPPDDTLMAAAAAGGLTTADAITAQYQRLMATAAGHAQMEQVVLQWLGEDQIGLMGSSSGPLTPAVAGDMLAEARGFIEEAIFNGSGTVKELLSGSYTFANTELASYYGLPTAGTTSQVSKVPLAAASGRGGLISQGAFLVSTSKMGVPLLHRGKVIRNKFLCETLPSVASLGLPGFTPPPLQAPAAGTTTRQALTSEIQGVCYTCHQYFMPIGFGLENFDSNGQFQTTQNGGAVDPSGAIVESTSIDPVTGLILDAKDVTQTTFSDYLGLSSNLAASPRVSYCFGSQLVSYASGRGDVRGDDCSVRGVQTAPGGSSDVTVQQQFLNYVQSKYFVLRSRT
jgi:hypothetical protein